MIIIIITIIVSPNLNNRGWCAEAVSMPKGKYRLPLFIRWLSLEFFSSHCRPQATSGSYRLNVVCIIRVFFKLHIPTHCYTSTYECVYMCEWVCVRANKVHCLTVYNRLSEMGIRREACMPLKFAEDYTCCCCWWDSDKVHMAKFFFEIIWASKKNTFHFELYWFLIYEVYGKIKFLHIILIS